MVKTCPFLQQIPFSVFLLVTAFPIMKKCGKIYIYHTERLWANQKEVLHIEQLEC